MENKKRGTSVRTCSKCETIYPQSQNVCPICHSDKFHPASALYSFLSICFGGVLFGLLLSIFSPTFGVIVFLIMMVVGGAEGIKTRSKLAVAKKSGGYWLPDKAQKIKADSFYNPTTTEDVGKSDSVQFEQLGYEYADRERALENFKDSLAVVWADTDKTIEFSYRDAKGDRSRRKIDLSEASVNDYGELYFIGFCWESLDSRSFKVKRITSKILYAGRRYDKDEFLRNILLLEPTNFE